MDLDKASQQLTVASHRIPYLLEALEYVNTRQAVIVNVDEHHRKSMDQLRSVYGISKVISGDSLPGRPSSTAHPETVFVDEAGMWSFNSNKDGLSTALLGS